MNGGRVHVEDVPSGADMLLGIPSSKDKLAVAVTCDWVATPGLICRNTGSTALHLALVASGAFAAAFSKRCKIWDIAAGALLVTEAGGLVTDPFGAARLPFNLKVDPGSDLPVLVGAPVAHRQLLDSVRATSRGPG